MKKKIAITVSIILLALIIILALYFLTFNKKDNSDRVLSLDNLKYNGEFQYTGLKWGLSSDQVKRKLPFSIAEETEIEPFNEHFTVYKSQCPFTLDGGKSVAEFEFYDDKLQMISFSYQIDDNYTEWFENQVAKLSELYGPEAQKVDNPYTVSYKWNTDTTMLQISLVKSDVKPAVHIGISLRPPHYQQ